MAATVVLLGSTFDTNSGTHTVTATPNSEDLIVIVTASSGNTSTAAPTDNNSVGVNTYSLVTNALKNTSADQLAIFVRKNFIVNGTSTVFTHAPGTSTGGGLAVYAIRGIAKADTGVIRQSAVQANHASSVAPAPTFGSAALTGNPIISAVFNATNPASITARSSPAYTRDINSGYSTPSAGIATMHINSGETGTAITWGAVSPSAFSSLAIELDTTVTKLENQQDTFPGSSLDTTKWYDNTGAGGTQTVSSSAVHLTAPALTANALAEVESLYFYDLTGSHAYVKPVVTQVADVNAEAALIVFHDENGNQMQITLINGTLQASYLIAGVQTNVGAGVSYNSSTMVWWRIRELSGTVFFEYSDGLGVWTALGSTAVSNITWGITLVRASMAVFDGASNATAEVGVFSNFNINQAPNTPTLTSPANTGTVSTTTPELDFSDTDVETDNLSYELEVDTVNTFDSFAGGTVSYSETNQDNTANVGGGAAHQGISQSFTSIGGILSSAKFYLKKSGTPTGSAVAKIYTHSGTYGSTSIPTGAALATSGNFDVSTLTTSFVLTTFTFSGNNQINLSNGTHYVLTIEYSGGDSSNFIIPGIDGSSPSSSGNYAELTSGTWNPSSVFDACFYVTTTNAPLIDALSSSGGHDAAQFGDIPNSGDTDPFPSGDSMKFTIPISEVLTNGTTYYWRVRAIDPSGSNTFSSWSATDSFTVSVATGIPNKIVYKNQAINRGSTY